MYQISNLLIALKIFSKNITLTYLSALEVIVLQTGGRIWVIHEDIVLGTFLTKTVKAGGK